MTTVTVHWMTRHGPMETPVVYRNVLAVADVADRLVLTFEKFTLWLFTAHMAAVQIEEPGK